MGKPWYRVRVLPAVIAHLNEVLHIVVDGFNTHVPATERGIDARMLLPAFGLRHAARRRLRFRPGRGNVHAAMADVPSKAKRAATWGALKSQLPSYDPSDEPVPPLAQTWLSRWDDGGDVVRWHSGLAAH